jgi:hypothetical protein
MNSRIFAVTLAFLVSGFTVLLAAERVTVENFARAETDTYNRGQMRAVGVGVGQLAHFREPITADNQTVIRQNQDTLYSGLILDLSKPARISMPETGGRYMSMHDVNQDHYMFVESEPGTYELTEELVGTRFASVAFRIFVDSLDAGDVEQAHAAQDGIVVEGGGSGPYEAPDWDQESLLVARTALSNLAELGFSTRFAYGTEEDTRPVDFLIGVAAGWGGLPARAAMYEVTSVSLNDGKTPHTVAVRDVPVNAFWSITVYNADGYLEKNEVGRNSLNNVTAQPNADGSYTLNFGGNPEAVNYLPISPGWNYTVRLYEPREEILDGSWTFPVPEAKNL